MDITDDIVAYMNLLQSTLAKLDISQINTFANILIEAYESQSTVYIFGNGGSAATASHFVCDFNKGVSENLDKKFNFVCLNDNLPSLMAIANDFGYAEIFVYQLKGKLKPSEVVIGISGSGNSPNVLKAIEYANEVGAITVGLTGYDGGQLKKISQYSIDVNVNHMQVTEDIHMILDHLMMTILKMQLKG